MSAPVSLGNKLVLDHPNAIWAPPASLLLAPWLEYWAVEA